MELRLARPGVWSRDQAHRDQWVGLIIKTETQTSKVSDRDSSRPKNFQVVETETCRDWMKVVETETLTRLFKEDL